MLEIEFKDEARAIAGIVKMRGKDGKAPVGMTDKEFATQVLTDFGIELAARQEKEDAQAVHAAAIKAASDAAAVKYDEAVAAIKK